MKRLHRCTGLIALAWLIGSCGGSDRIMGPPPPTVASVTVSHDTATLVPAAAVQLSAVARTASGEQLQREFSWSTSDAAKATVSNSGMVVGVAQGVATITATADGKSATATITVLDGGIISSSGGTVTAQAGAVQIVVPTDALASTTNLSVAPSSAVAGDPSVVAGSAFDFGPQGTSFAKPVVIKIKYDAANLPSGTEEAALELCVKTSSGWDVVPQSTVDLNAKTVSASVSHFSTYGIHKPDPVAGIGITGASPLTVGASEQLTATITGPSEQILTNRHVSWSSSDPSIVSINPTGNQTVTITGLQPGTATISASAGGKSATVLIPVGPVPVAAVILSAPTTPMIVGGTQPLTAITKDAAGNVLTDRPVTWVSSNAAVLTVSGTGLVTAAGQGTATITATSESASATTPVITVNPVPVATVTVTPPSASIVVGSTQQLTATLKDANSNTLSGRTIAWSSNSAAATVDANGLVTAVSVGGPVTITATSEGKSGTSSVTVTAVPVASVALSTATTPMIVGGTQQLSAVTRDANGNVLTGRPINWGSSNTAVLTVSATGLVTAAGQGTATITATSESVAATTPVITVNPVPVATVTVTPPSATIVVGGTEQLSAVTRDGSGNLLSGRSIVWLSANTAIATVDANGLVTAVSAGGPITISATSEGKSGTSSITVNPIPVATVTVNPASASILVGSTQQLAATLRDANNNILTGRSVTWGSNNNAVATVDANGLVTAVSVGGPVSITATSEGKTGTSSITVIPTPVTSVTLSTPTTPMIVGESQVLTALPRDGNGATLSGRTVTWVSSNTAILTVSAASSVSTSSGATMTVTAAGTGVATITVTSESAPPATTPQITVNSVPVATVTVNPPSATIFVGSTSQLTATPRDANNNILTGRTITWSSNNNAVAAVDANGLVTAMSAGGPVTITATSEGHSGTSSITVNPVPVASVTLSAPTTPMVVGETQLLTATPKDANGVNLSGRTVNWVSSNTAVLTVSSASSVSGSSGATVTITAAGVGTATITATSETATAATTPVVTVNPVPVATVTVTPPSATIIVGGTQQLSATTRDAGGNVLTGRTVTWSSSASGVASVDANGLVTGVAAGGPVTITATSETQTGTSSITVNPVPVASVTLSAPTTPMVVGATQVLTATPRDANGAALSGRTVNWVSSNTSVLTLSAGSSVSTPTGATITVRAAGVGTATITATSESAPSATTPLITVNPAPVATVTVAPASASIAVGGTQQLVATLRDANNNVLTGRTITWSSANTAVATVDGNGLVTGVATGGPMNITATSEGKTGSSSITVTGSTLTLRASPFVTSGFTAPLFLTQPLNDGRIFVVDQTGQIRVVLNGVLQGTPFLDISSKVLYGGERGLLSVAFHPNYATNHYFYVYYTSQPSGDIVIDRFTASSDPSVADPTSEKLIFTTPHPNGNHNGGLVSFGLDGMMYAALGDGGVASNAQNLNIYLGGMIRIDVDGGDPYAIPSDNPYVGQTGRRPELWAKGLRNPWRYAFDQATGLLFIADVGESAHEEVDAVAATQGGLNYGWSIMEGFSCFNPSTGCNQSGLQLPIFDYPHSGGACSITGGYVYHGSAMPAIQGHYFYSDFCAAWLHSLRYENGAAVDQRDWALTFPMGQVRSFGQDIFGELYVMSGSGVYKIVPGP